MEPKLRHRPPGRLARMVVTFRTKLLAHREGEAPTPFQVHDGEQVNRANATYQRNVENLLRGWIEDLARAAMNAFSASRTALTKLFVKLEELEDALPGTVAAANHPLRFGGLSAATMITVALACVLGLATVWPFVLSLDWALPLTALTAIAFATIEVVLALMVGTGGAALSLDKTGSPFELTPRVRTIVSALTVVLALLLVAFTGLLAWARGENGQPMLWLTIGLIDAGLGIHTGLALYEARFHLQLARLRRDIGKTRAAIANVVHGHDLLTRRVMAAAGTLVEIAHAILLRGDATVQRTWRRRHYEVTAIVPAIPAPEFPTTEELERRLIVPLEIDRFDLDAPDPATETSSPPTAMSSLPTDTRR